SQRRRWATRGPGTAAIHFPVKAAIGTRPYHVARNPARSSYHVMCTKLSSTATLMYSRPRLRMLRRRATPGDGAVLTLKGALNVLPPSVDVADQISKRSGRSTYCQTSFQPCGAARPVPAPAAWG